MIVFKRFTPIYLLCLLSSLLNAQTAEPCYERFLKEGLAAQERFDFDLAIYKLEAAQICPDKPLQDSLDNLLTAVNQAKIKAITEARDQARHSEEKALQQLTISESNRLAFLANREREKGNTTVAIKLAYRAMQIAGNQASKATQRAFGDAVYRSTLKELKGHRQAIRSATFSHDGELLMSVSQDSSIIIWKKNGEQLVHLQQFEEGIQSGHFSPDGKHILSASGHKAELWNLQGQRIQQFTGHTDLVYKVVFSNNGQMVATASRDQSIGIWNVQTGELIASCKGYEAAVHQVTFSKDDSSLLGLSADKSIRIWNTAGTILQEIRHDNLYFGGAIFGPKNDQLLSYTVDHAMQIWAISSGQLLNEIKEHQGLIRQVTMAPEEAGFLSCGTDRMAIFWDAAGRQQFRLDDHSAAVNYAGFSNDGNYIISCSADGTAKLYTKNDQLLMDLSGFYGPVNSIAISPDNQYIIAVGQESVVYLCQNPQTYYPYLKSHPPEAFTTEEKEKYAILDSLN